MEAGFDYLLLRGRFQRKTAKFIGISLFVLGALLLASGGAYYGYAARARADLDELNVSLPGSIEGANQGSGIPAASDRGQSGSVYGEADILSPAEQDDGNKESQRLAKLLPAISLAAIGARQLYPGEELVAGYWSNPWAYEPSSYQEMLLLQGFTPIELGDLPSGSIRTAATRLRVPAIGIDSSVKELEILDLGGSRAYETPVHTVGHIPATANAGETGSSWFFGHTESPTLGEGSVFFNLSKIPDKLRNGEDVFIIADNDEKQFLYRVTSSQVVSQEDMRLYDTGEATIHLVSCLPRWVYDHRLIITGELVAQKSNS
jgi:LPXTG-site transpeptidase (sortase) family protein